MVVELARAHGAEARAVQLSSAQEVQARAPLAFGVFGILYDGELVSYHYLDRKGKERLVALLTEH